MNYAITLRASQLQICHYEPKIVWLHMKARSAKANTNDLVLFLIYESYMGRSAFSSSGDNSSRPRSGLKQTRLWVTGRCFVLPAWARLAGSGDSHPAATQAAPTGETTGESTLVTPPCPLLSPSIHPVSPWHPLSATSFSYPPLPDAFVFSSYPTVPIYSNHISVRSLQSFPNFPSSFICATFSFI